MYILITASLGLYSREREGERKKKKKPILLANKMHCILRRPHSYSQNTEDKGEEKKLNLKSPIDTHLHT